MSLDYSLSDLHWKHDLLGSIEIGIVVLDKDFKVQVWNQFMENYSSIVPSQIKDKVIFEFFPEIDQKWFTTKTNPTFTLRSPVFMVWEQSSYLFHFESNRPITCQSNFMYQNITIFPLASLTGQVEQICLMVYDVTDEAVSRKGMLKLNQQLKSMSRIDGLTGLNNRRYWEEQFALEYKRAQRNENEASVIIIDIDLFKTVNDTYGHQCGDELIRALANIIKRATRETDLSGRYGGDEFVILLPDTPAVNVNHVAERIRRLVEQERVTFENQEISFTVSLGVSGLKHTHQSHMKWLENADQALYKAKELGRNQVSVA